MCCGFARDLSRQNRLLSPGRLEDGSCLNLNNCLPAGGVQAPCKTVVGSRNRSQILFARANPESGPKLPIVSLRLPTARQKIDQGWSLQALNWDNYVAHVHRVDRFYKASSIHDERSNCSRELFHYFLLAILLS